VVSAVLNAVGKRYLVEHQEADDGSWWYDRYSDGWVVQGGIEPFKSGNPQQITLPIAMQNTDYPIYLTINMRTGNTWGTMWGWAPYGTPISTTVFNVFNDQGAKKEIYFTWQVQGYAA
jgi:hypothetical protein